MATGKKDTKRNGTILGTQGGDTRPLTRCATQKRTKKHQLAVPDIGQLGLLKKRGGDEND